MLLTILLLKQIEHRQELSEIKLPWIKSSISQQMCAIVVCDDAMCIHCYHLPVVRDQGLANVVSTFDELL